MVTASFNVPSITCSICSGKIKGALEGMDGIESININLKTQQVNVAYNPSEVRPQDIKRQIMELGYEIVG